MPRICAFLVILALSGASPLFAESRVDVDGNALYGWCRTTPGGLHNEPVGGSCAGFIHGVVDVHGEKTTIYGFRACLPHSVTIRELARIDFIAVLGEFPTVPQDRSDRTFRSPAIGNGIS